MKIDCQDVHAFSDTFIDGELAERERVEFETHLEDCDECRHRIEDLLRFKHSFKMALSQERAPEDLRQKILDEIVRQSSAAASRTTRVPVAPGVAANTMAAPDEAAATAPGAEPPRRSLLSGKLGRFALVASPLAAASLFVFLTGAFTIAPAASSSQADTPAVADQTIKWHRDAAEAIHSSRPQDVTSWFNGRVDFPVRLPHFPADRVQLLSGHMAHIQSSHHSDERVRSAALVRYSVDGHKLSVLMFHGDEADTVPADRVQTVNGRRYVLLNNNGYEVAVVRDGGITYSITSDMPPADFRRIVETSLER